MDRHGSNRGHKHLDQASCLVKNHCLLVKSASSPKIHVCLSKSVSQHINLLHHVSKFHMSRYGTCLKTKQGNMPCKRWHLRCIYFHTTPLAPTEQNTHPYACFLGPTTAWDKRVKGDSQHTHAPQSRVASIRVTYQCTAGTDA